MTSLVDSSLMMGLPMMIGAHSEDEVQFALDWISSAVEGYCERQFTYVASDTVTINPYVGDGGKPQAMLPNPPVSDVSTVMGQFAFDGGLQWIELLHYGWVADGLIYDTNRYYGYRGVTGSSFWSGVDNAQGAFDYDNVPSWPTLPRSLQVTYSHGYTLPGAPTQAGVPVLPGALSNEIIKSAAQVLVNPAGVAQESAGIISTSYHSLIGSSGGPAGSMLDEIALAPYRLVYL